MTDEMKLITALCEAMGFEVERHVEVTKGTHTRRHNGPSCFGQRLFPEWAEYEFLGNGEYREIKRDVSYKLKKRPAPGG